jgi:histidyl-tRNA synthetase
VDFDLKRRAMKKQLEYTDSTGVPYVIIVGQKELDKGVVKLKDMAQRTEIEMTLDDAVNTIKRT